MLRQEQRLRKGFVSLLKSGRRLTSSHFVIISRETHNLDTQVGILISKKVGIAVDRNTLKRRIRSIMEEWIRTYPKKFDIILIPSKYTKNWNQVTFAVLKEELLNLMNQL